MVAHSILPKLVGRGTLDLVDVSRVLTSLNRVGLDRTLRFLLRDLFDAIYGDVGATCGSDHTCKAPSSTGICDKARPGRTAASLNGKHYKLTRLSRGSAYHCQLMVQVAICLEYEQLFRAV